MKALHGVLIDDENKITDDSIVSSRVTDTIYQNTSNRPKLIIIDSITTLEDTTGGELSNEKGIYIDPTSAGVTALNLEIIRVRPRADLLANIGIDFPCNSCFIVPPKWFYSMVSIANTGDANGFGIVSWKEYEL